MTSGHINHRINSVRKLVRTEVRMVVEKTD